VIGINGVISELSVSGTRCISVGNTDTGIFRAVAGGVAGDRVESVGLLGNRQRRKYSGLLCELVDRSLCAPSSGGRLVPGISFQA